MDEGSLCHCSGAPCCRRIKRVGDRTERREGPHPGLCTEYSIEATTTFCADAYASLGGIPHAIKSRVARLERSRAAALAPPVLSHYEADVAWTERFTAWSAENTAFVREIRAIFGGGMGGAHDPDPVRMSRLSGGLLFRSKPPESHGLLMAEDMADREEIVTARRLLLRLFMLMAEYTEATGDRHPEYRNPRQSMPYAEALLARPIRVEAKTWSEQCKPVYEFLDRMMPGKGIMELWRA
jgi:hypothetical protein